MRATARQSIATAVCALSWAAIVWSGWWFVDYWWLGGDSTWVSESGPSSGSAALIQSDFDPPVPLVLWVPWIVLTIGASVIIGRSWKRRREDVLEA